MTTTRILPGMVLLLATAGPVAAQSGGGSYPPTGQPGGPAPSFAPTEADLGLAMPPGRPSAAMGANPTALDRVTAPVRPTGVDAPDPVGMLTGQPVASGEPPLPPGAYPSPYYTDGPGCCGPLGRNGRIGYEIDFYTGPTLILGRGRFSDELQTGWMEGGNGRSLFFNPTHDAAWVAVLGISHQYNRGTVDDYQNNLFIHQPNITNPFTGAISRQPDVLSPTAIRGLFRTSFNFGVGRDWWLWGPGSTGMENGWNLRVGGDVGGRWGTAHVDLLPQDVAAFGNYQRRQGVYHGFFLAPHINAEVPMGSWILFGGFRAEWSYDWMNLVPPLRGNLSSVNLLFTIGARF